MMWPDWDKLTLEQKINRLAAVYETVIERSNQLGIVVRSHEDRIRKLEGSVSFEL